MRGTEPSSELQEAVRDGIARAAAVIGLAGIALIHVLDMPDTFRETPYKGWMFLALAAGCVVTAALLIRSSDRRAWALALLLPLGAIAGYVVSRTVGLPGSADDIGNWSEPLGIASLFVEGSVAALGAAVLFEPKLLLGPALAPRTAVRT